MFVLALANSRQMDHAPLKIEKFPEPTVTKAVPSLGVMSLDCELHVGP